MRAKELVEAIEKFQKGRVEILNREQEDGMDTVVWKEDILVRKQYWEELKKKVNGE